MTKLTPPPGISYPTMSMVTKGTCTIHVGYFTVTPKWQPASFTFYLDDYRRLPRTPPRFRHQPDGWDGRMGRRDSYLRPTFLIPSQPPNHAAYHPYPGVTSRVNKMDHAAWA